MSEDYLRKIRFPDVATIKLVYGQSKYPLPPSENSSYSAFLFGGLRLISEKEAEGQMEFWDYKIEENHIIFSRDFMRLVEHEIDNEDIIKIIYLENK